jgi:NADPH-dependent 2,4-dienoyl-CoA reductase/sulfur reductase-like enzyme
MAPLDIEMAALVHSHLAKKGVKLVLNDGVAGFEAGPDGKGLVVKTASGGAFSGGLVMLVIGVRPETGLAKAAGLELGARGGIKVDDHMRTR